MTKSRKYLIFNKQLVKDIDNEIIPMVWDVFERNAKDELGQMQVAFEQNNFIEVKRLAHKIKGGSILVGLEAISNAAMEIEEDFLKNGEVLQVNIALLNEEFGLFQSKKSVLLNQ